MEGYNFGLIFLVGFILSLRKEIWLFVKKKKYTSKFGF